MSDAKSTWTDRLDAEAVGRGAGGFLVAATYTVVAAAGTLVPPSSLVGPRVGFAVWVGLLVAGVVAAGWAGFDVGRGDASLRRLVTFVVTAWILLIPLGVLTEGVLGLLLGTGDGGGYLLRLLGFGVATAAAGWMAYGGGWERARGRMGSGGLDRM